jgi:hypothetical protein
VGDLQHRVLAFELLSGAQSPPGSFCCRPRAGSLRAVAGHPGPPGGRVPLSGVKPEARLP